MHCSLVGLGPMRFSRLARARGGRSGASACRLPECCYRLARQAFRAGCSAGAGHDRQSPMKNLEVTFSLSELEFRCENLFYLW